MMLSVITQKEGRAGRITLNRPGYGHALNREMNDKITRALTEWSRSGEVEFVLVDHIEGTSGFCVGNDVRLLAESARSLDRDTHLYLQSVYRLFHSIATLPIPYIAVMDGGTAGHGIGLSINGKYRIATERTVISFPETSYGSIPDGGATRFLSRLPNELGTWLALTGATLSGHEVSATNLATHYCSAQALPSLKRSLIDEGIDALSEYATDQHAHSIDHLPQMKRFFRGDCLKIITARLGRGGPWALEQARKIDAKSPLASKIALRQLRTGRFLDSVSSALKIEYRILSRLVGSQDFQEGVRARYVDKDHCPHWRPCSLNRITTDMVGKYFTPLSSQELRLGHSTTVITEPV